MQTSFKKNVGTNIFLYTLKRRLKIFLYFCVHLFFMYVYLKELMYCLVKACFFRYSNCHYWWLMIIHWFTSVFLLLLKKKLLYQSYYFILWNFNNFYKYERLPNYNINILKISVGTVYTQNLKSGFDVHTPSCPPL